VRWRVLGLVKARVPWGSLSVGPQVGFRPHGWRAAAKAGHEHDAKCISGSLSLFFSLFISPDTHPPPFVKKKAKEKKHARQERHTLPSVQCTTAAHSGRLAGLSNKIID
jgi:hypothetical protein